MTSDLHAAYYADRACHVQATVLGNVRIARDTFRIRVSCPDIARRIVPGQFVMVKLAGMDDPVLARPLALYDTVVADGERGAATAIDIVYLVVGKMTGRLASWTTGQELEVWGPLGNGFAPEACGGGSPEPCRHLLMVAGGIGQTPFMALAREVLGLRQYGDPPRRVAPSTRVTLCYGARNKDYLAGVDDFTRLGVDVRTSTDDGSAGRHGLVTELAAEVLAESPQAHVVCCGPEPMMAAVARLAAARGAACQVSLETPMACGIGICFSCVARVRDDDGGWDYRRTCVEGPMFDAARIEW
jgi:dihydroorotate dehydrogenase electron transfer subunit